MVLEAIDRKPSDEEKRIKEWHEKCRREEEAMITTFERILTETGIPAQMAKLKSVGFEVEKVTQLDDFQFHHSHGKLKSFVIKTNRKTIPYQPAVEGDPFSLADSGRGAFGSLAVPEHDIYDKTTIIVDVRDGSIRVRSNRIWTKDSSYSTISRAEWEESPDKIWDAIAEGMNV